MRAVAGRVYGTGTEFHEQAGHGRTARATIQPENKGGGGRVGAGREVGEVEVLGA